MATLQSLNLLFKPSSSPSHRRRTISAALQTPTHLSTSRHLPRLPTMTNLEDHLILTSSEETTKLYAIAEAAVDRAEMHAAIGQQRNNWGHLLLHSVNSITLTASLMAGISAIPTTTVSPHLLAFKLSSFLLFSAATFMMVIMDKIQPSQLAEEQRNAARLYRQLDASIHTSLALRSPSQSDVDGGMDRVLALDKAYPLPLLPGMLNKFPNTVEPAVWWPKLKGASPSTQTAKNNKWSEDLANEMEGVLKVLKEKDTENYVSFARSVLRINRCLAVVGPVLAGVAAAAAMMVGVAALGPWPAVVGVVGGAMAAVVNTLQHGGQVGMIFELSRNCAGFYRRLEEEIECNLGGTGEDSGDLFEMKMALQLGRSVSELREFAASHAAVGGEEFAGKLF